MTINERLDELSALQDGWLDGEGKRPDPDGLEWVRRYFDAEEEHQTGLPEIRLFPTPEGNVEAEWREDGAAVSLEFDLDGRVVERMRVLPSWRPLSQRMQKEIPG